MYACMQEMKANNRESRHDMSDFSFKSFGKKVVKTVISFLKFFTQTPFCVQIMIYCLSIIRTYQQYIALFPNAL